MTDDQYEELIYEITLKLRALGIEYISRRELCNTLESLSNDWIYFKNSNVGNIYCPVYDVLLNVCSAKDIFELITYSIDSRLARGINIISSWPRLRLENPDLADKLEKYASDAIAIKDILT